MFSQPVVLRNVSLEPFDSQSDTVVIDGGLITAVGTWAEVSNLVTAESKTIDCSGKSLLPGIDDSHLHAYMLGRQLSGVNVSPELCPDVASVNAALQKASAKYATWIRGFGWVSGRTIGSGPEGSVTAADLDKSGIDKPIVLTDFSGHLAWCNSIALKLAGINQSTAEPSGGVIVRYEDGTPTGLLIDSAVELVTKAISKPDQTERLTALRTAREILLSNGITALTDPGIGPGAASLDDGTADLPVIEDYKHLAANDELDLRVNIMLLFGGLGGTTPEHVIEGLDAFGKPEFTSEASYINISQLKIFADGIPRSRTAWLSEPYDNHTHGSMTLAGDTDEERLETLRGIFAAATKRNWQIGFHSTGDATTGALIDLLEANPYEKNNRHYVIHGDLIQKSDFARMAESGLYLTAQPAIRWFVSRNVEGILGKERSDGRQQLRSQIEAGVPVSLSSDAPVSSADWRLIYAAAVSRSLKTEPEFSDDQKLTPLQALTAMTQTPAKQSKAETWRGRIAPGFVADLFLVDRKIDFNEDPWSLMQSKVQATFVGGKLVFGDL